MSVFVREISALAAVSAFVATIGLWLFGLHDLI